MALGLFDHVKACTQTQSRGYWETLDEPSRKAWSTYMILRFLSMNPDWIELIAEVQPYLQSAPPRAVYLALIQLIPKSPRYFAKYMKAAKEDRYEPWLISLVSLHYLVSKAEAEVYLDILYTTEVGKQEVRDIAAKYGTDPKLVKKL